MVNRLIAFFLFLFALPAITWAQVDDAQKKYTAFDMRSNGKIYVVVAVSLTILIGLFVYLIFLDKKISRFEKNKE